MAAGRPYPIAPKPEVKNVLCPGLFLKPAKKNSTASPELPAVISAPSGRASESLETKCAWEIGPDSGKFLRSEAKYLSFQSAHLDFHCGFSVLVALPRISFMKSAASITTGWSMPIHCLLESSSASISTTIFFAARANPPGL